MEPRRKHIAGTKQRLQKARQSYIRLTGHFRRTISVGSKILGGIAVIASLMCITVLAIRGGFYHDVHNLRSINLLLRICHLVFLANVIFKYLFDPRNSFKQTRVIKWIVDIAMLVTLLPLLYPHPEHPWIPILSRILYSRYFLYGILVAYSISEISYAVMTAVGKRTSPPLLLAISFMILIIIGSLALMMPRCTIGGINFIDSLFVATSAVCITGLTTVDVSQTFTPTGLLVLALLIQAGGLGVLTFTSFFALFFMGNNSIYSQMMVKDMVYSKSFNSLLPTILYILGFTLSLEAAGAVCIFLCVHDTLHMTLHQEMIFAAFHSLSAFCNAGFSNIEGGLSNPLLLHSKQSIYLIISFLVMAGGIGFPILVNVKSAIARYAKRLWNRIIRRELPPRPSHIYDLNTKIACYTTMVVFVVSAVLFFLFEYDNTLDGMSFYDKMVQSIFNAWVPRSSGFASVDPSNFLNITIIMFIVLMWIGGGSQSTAGGIKVNTFATMILSLKASITGNERVAAFHRTIAPMSLRRTHAVVATSILAYIFVAMLLIGLEPTLPARDLLYEAASALFTVGSSLGVTPRLGMVAKLLLCAAMFVGRVGIISLLMGFISKKQAMEPLYPTDNIIIN